MFGTVGASVDFTKINAIYLGYGVVCIICGVVIRAIVTFFVSYQKKFTIKERLFFSIAWITKATV